MTEQRPARVAFVINDLSGGGAERALQLLAEHLGDTGIAVRIVTLQGGGDAYDIANGVETVTLSTGRLSRGVGKLALLPVQAFELARILRAWRPDICVSHLPRANIAHVMTRWFGNRNVIAITEHFATAENYSPTSRAGRTMRWLIRAAYPRADAVIAVSEGVAEGLVAFGVPRHRIHVIHNAISVDAIRAAAAEPPASTGAGDTPTIVTVGRHVAQKRHDLLLRAFARLRDDIAARLVIVGQGPLRGELEALAGELGIADAVSFAGWQRNPFAWIARSDLFVLSSGYEGFGNVIVEAMACGVPVISTDCRSGPREILEGGEAGVLVPVGDVPALADAMRELLTDTVRRTTLLQRGVRRAAEFDISRIGPAYLALIQSLLPVQSEPGPAAASRASSITTIGAHA